MSLYHLSYQVDGLGQVRVLMSTSAHMCVADLMQFPVY